MYNVYNACIIYKIESCNYVILEFISFDRVYNSHVVFVSEL